MRCVLGRRFEHWREGTLARGAKAALVRLPPAAFAPILSHRVHLAVAVHIALPKPQTRGPAAKWQGACQLPVC